MVRLLRRLKSRLSDTVDAWDKFQRKEIGYFLLDDSSATSSSPLESSVSAVDDVFLDLKGFLKKLQQLENELCQDNPQGVSSLSVFFLYLHVNSAELLTEVRLIETAKRSF
jgi:hypothetical protein